MMCLGILGVTQLDTDFPTTWNVRDGTYVKDFLVSRERLFGHSVEAKGRRNRKQTVSPGILMYIVVQVMI